MVSRGERPGLGLSFKQHHAPRLCVLHRLINSAMRFNLRSLRINAKLEDVVGVLLAHTCVCRSGGGRVQVMRATYEWRSIVVRQERELTGVASKFACICGSSRATDLSYVRTSLTLNGLSHHSW